MQKDYKIGLVVGLVTAGAATIWVATRPSLSPEARMLRSSHAAPNSSPVGLADLRSSPTTGDPSAALTSPKVDKYVPRAITPAEVERLRREAQHALKALSPAFDPAQPPFGVPA